MRVLTWADWQESIVSHTFKHSKWSCVSVQMLIIQSQSHIVLCMCNCSATTLMSTEFSGLPDVSCTLALNHNSQALIRALNTTIIKPCKQVGLQVEYPQVVQHY